MPDRAPVSANVGLHSPGDNAGASAQMFRNLKPWLIGVAVEAVFFVLNAQSTLDAATPSAVRVLAGSSCVLFMVGALVCFRAGILVSDAGVAVRSYYGRTVRAAWSEVQCFRLRRTERGNERVAVVLTDGRELSTGCPHGDLILRRQRR